MSNNPQSEVPAGSPGSKKVISVQGNDINKVINAQTGGQAPQQNQPSGNQVPPKQSGGGPEGPATQNTTGLRNAVSPPTGVVNKATGQVTNNANTAPGTDPTVPNNDDIDIEKMISTSEGEVKTLDEETQRRKDVTEHLTKALSARGRFERLIYNNIETGEMIGTKLRYLKDNDGKTIYDYMNDPLVSQYIEFVAAEGDPMDGSPVDRQLTFYWKKPTL